MNATDAALAALEQWAAQRKKLDQDRPRLVVTAWNAGNRSVTALAKAANVARDTIYGDLRAAKIDPSNKNFDPALTRLVRAVVQLAMAFNPGHPFNWKTHAEYAPALTEAAALLVSFEEPELVAAVAKLLAIVPPDEGDAAMLAPFLTELRAAYEDYTAGPRPAELPPMQRFLRARSHPNVVAPPPDR